MVCDSLVGAHLHTGLYHVASAIELGDLVLVIAYVEAHVQYPVICLHWLAADGDFNTCVLQLTLVLQQGVVHVQTCWDGRGVEQVLGLTVVSVNAQSEAVLEHTEVDTHVVCCRCLPGEVLIVCQWLVHDAAQTCYWVVVVAVGTPLIYWGVVLLAGVLLTCLSPSEAQLEV